MLSLWKRPRDASSEAQPGGISVSCRTDRRSNRRVRQLSVVAEATALPDRRGARKRGGGPEAAVHPQQRTAEWARAGNQEGQRGASRHRAGLAGSNEGQALVRDAFGLSRAAPRGDPADGVFERIAARADRRDAVAAPRGYRRVADRYRAVHARAILLQLQVPVGADHRPAAAAG